MFKKKRKENKARIIKKSKDVEELEVAYFLEQKPRLLFEIEQTLTLLILSEIKILKFGLNKKEAKIIKKLEHSLKKGIEAIKSLRSESSNRNIKIDSDEKMEDNKGSE